jgi:hypothetical protein
LEDLATQIQVRLLHTCYFRYPTCKAFVELLLRRQGCKLFAASGTPVILFRSVSARHLFLKVAPL